MFRKALVKDASWHKSPNHNTISDMWYIPQNCYVRTNSSPDPAPEMGSLQSYRHLLKCINLFPHAMDTFFKETGWTSCSVWFIDMTYRPMGCWTVTFLRNPLNSLKLLRTQLSSIALCTKLDSVLNFLRIENLSCPHWCLLMAWALSLICKTPQCLLKCLEHPVKPPGWLT